MCGRYTQISSPQKISKEFKVPFNITPKFHPAYNIAPSQPVLALLVENNNQKFDFVNWGLIPSWAKDPAIGNRMINARAETISEKPSYRGPFKHSRCLVIADGFYEWKKGPGASQPYYIRLKSKNPFGFAGLWSHWTSDDGSEIRSCTIITTEADDFMRPIHNRMPVILQEKARGEWLDPHNSDQKTLLSLLGPYPAKEMEAYPISKIVNSPINDLPDCIKPIS